MTVIAGELMSWAARRGCFDRVWCEGRWNATRSLIVVIGVIAWYILLAIVCFAGCLISPRWLWRKLSAWAYRDPKANEPSETAYAVSRGTLLVSAIVCLLVAVSQCSADRQTAERRDAWADEYSYWQDVEAEKRRARDDNPDPYPEDLVAKGVARALSLEPGGENAYGHIIGYQQDSKASAVTVDYWLSACGHLHSAWADEYSYDYKVLIRLVEATDGQKFTKKCPKKDRNSGAMQSTTIPLTRPLDNRWVVLVDGGRVHPR